MVGHVVDIRSNKGMRTKILFALLCGVALSFLGTFFIPTSAQSALQQDANWKALIKLHCADVPLLQVDSISLLPGGVASLLGNKPIADRGEVFNPADVVWADSPPSRRFAMAGVSKTCALVAVEYGGRTSGVELYAFELRDRGWKGGLASRTSRKVRSLVDLREVFYSKNL
jgi:hypothetical protein